MCYKQLESYPRPFVEDKAHPSPQHHHQEAPLCGIRDHHAIKIKNMNYVSRSKTVQIGSQNHVLAVIVWNRGDNDKIDNRWIVWNRLVRLFQWSLQVYDRDPLINRVRHKWCAFLVNKTIWIQKTPLPFFSLKRVATLVYGCQSDSAFINGNHSVKQWFKGRARKMSFHSRPDVLVKYYHRNESTATGIWVSKEITSSASFTNYVVQVCRFNLPF